MCAAADHCLEGDHDQNVNQNGVYHSLIAAKPAYDFLHADDKIGISFADRPHGEVQGDWDAMFAFADKFLMGKPTHVTFDQYPPGHGSEREIAGRSDWRWSTTRFFWRKARDDGQGSVGAQGLFEEGCARHAGGSDAGMLLGLGRRRRRRRQQRCLQRTGGCGPAKPKVVLNVKDYGATGDGKTKDTVALQLTIERCSALGGGEVIVPAGDYLTGALALRSNVTLRLEEGATLNGSPDIRRTIPARKCAGRVTG